MESSAAPPVGESAPSPTPERVRIGGAWAGVLEVNLSTWTLPMLRAEVSRRSGRGAPTDYINLICGGKVLRDGDVAAAPPRSLLELGVKNNCKILANAVSPDRGKALNDEAARTEKLSRLRAAALAFAGRHAVGSLPVEDFNVELENQSGQIVEFGSETDKKGLMMGLMLHTNAKSLIKKQQYKDALDVLSMAEEAFSLCDPKVTEMIDNVPILELDTVWCYFMLRDISCLSVAGMRLANARKGFERSHGKDSARFRLLHEGRQAELAIYLRLELLEGIIAYYSGNFAESRKSLSSAQDKYIQLQVPDEALSLLMNMGYKERAAKRAFRMAGQDIQRAVDFLVEERARKTRRYEENIQRQAEIMEQKRYGKTPMNKAVDLQRLNELVSIGFERQLAAEALRLNENDTQNALDDLTNPEQNSKLQHQIELRNKLRAQRRRAAHAEELVSTGHDTSAEAPGNGSQQAGSGSSVEGQASNPLTQEQVGSLGAAAAAAVGRDEEMEEVLTKELTDERDEEMEEELTKELTADPLEDYDIEVTIEGEAIAEYLLMIESNTRESKTSR